MALLRQALRCAGVGLDGMVEEEHTMLLNGLPVIGVQLVPSKLRFSMVQEQVMHDVHVVPVMLVDIEPQVNVARQLLSEPRILGPY